MLVILGKMNRLHHKCLRQLFVTVFEVNKYHMLTLCLEATDCNAWQSISTHFTGLHFLPFFPPFITSFHIHMFPVHNLKWIHLYHITDKLYNNRVLEKKVSCSLWCVPIITSKEVRAILLLLDAFVFHKYPWDGCCAVKSAFSRAYYIIEFYCIVIQIVNVTRGELWWIVMQQLY